MKTLRIVRVVLAALVALCACAAAPARAQGWQPIGPDYGTVLTLAHQPGNDAVALAGTYFGGVYRSTDWGYNWKVVDVPFAASSVFAVTFDPRAPMRAYAAVYGSGIWRSVDSGVTWSAASSGLTDLVVQQVRADPLVSLRVLAATASGLFASTDGAGTWTPVAALAGVSTRSIAFDPLHAGVIYVGTIGRGVYRSLDGGASWGTINPATVPATITSLAFDKAGNLFAATETGVLALKAGATTWTDLTYNLPGTPVADVYPHPTSANLLFASTGTGVFAISNWPTSTSWTHWTGTGARFTVTDSQGYVFHVAGEIGTTSVTSDFGTTWSRGDYGIQAAFVGGMASTTGGNGRRLLAGTDLGVQVLDGGQAWKNVLPLREGVFEMHARDGAVYAGMETTGVWKSGDGGTTWSAASNGIVPTLVANLGFSVETAPTLFAATGSGAYRSVDSGKNWTAIQLPEISYVHAIAADPVRPPIVYLGSGGGRVYRSLDSGKTFALANGNLPNDDVVSLVHAPWTGVYAVMASGALYQTTDNGFTWYPSNTGCTSPAKAVAVEPQRSWIVYLATAGGGLCKSTSGGIQWAPINAGIGNPYVASLWMNATNPSQLWAGSVGRVYRTGDGGTTWATATSGLPASGLVTALVGDPNNASHLLAILYGFGLYESVDGGATWTLRSASDVAKSALSLRFDPATANRLLIGTPNVGVQVSIDGGTSWQASSKGMSLFVRTITSDPGSASTLYAGTLGGGVFRSTDASLNWTNIGLAAGNVFRVRSPVANQVLVGTGNGIAASDDGGTSWAQLGQYAAFVFSAITDPADSRRIVAGGSDGLVWTADTTGTRWRAFGSGLPSADMTALALCGDGTVYASPETGVWKNALATPGAWQNAGGAGLGAARITALSCDPRSGYLYASTNGKGAFLSTNGGAGWTAINKGITSTVATAVVPSALTSFQVWVAYQDGKVWRSNNAGLDWTAMSTGLPSSGGVSQLVTGVDGAMYAGTAQGVYRITATGTSWVSRNTGLPAGVLTALWADPKRSTVLMAAVSGKGTYMTTNAGTSWAKVTTDANAGDVSTFAGDAGRVWMGTFGTGLAWTASGGSAFGAVQLPQNIPQVVTDMVVDGATTYLATGGQGVLLSRDGGGHWLAASSGLADLNLLCLVRHPTRSGELYAGTHAGVFVSKNGGASWTAYNTGLVNRNVTSLTFDAQVPDYLYVGLEGGGIWFRDTTK